MIKPLAFLLALAAAITVVVAVAPGVNATPATAVVNNQLFPDSVGDVVSPGGDVASVNVSNTDQGAITMVVNEPNRPALTGDMFYFVLIDADANPATGSPETLGSDYIIELDGPFNGQAAAVGMFRWNGSDYTGAGVPQASLTFGYANGALTININAAELGATKKFSFAVIAVSDVVADATGEPNFDAAHYDYAPDLGHGFFTYEVKTTPPALVVKSSGMRPAKPKAGKAFSVFLVYARADGSTATGVDTVACKATVAGKAVRTVGVVANNRATCTFTVPKTAKGKTLKATVTVTSSEGTKATKTFSAKVT